MPDTATDLIDVDQVIETLREIVTEHGPDYVYPNKTTCMYFERDADGNLTPSCIVGHVLHRLTPPEFREEFFTRFNGCVINGSISILLAGTRFTPEAIRVLRAAQGSQDRRETWGMALQEAESLANYLAGVRAGLDDQGTTTTG